MDRNVTRGEEKPYFMDLVTYVDFIRRRGIDHLLGVLRNW